MPVKYYHIVFCLLFYYLIPEMWGENYQNIGKRPEIVTKIKWFELFCTSI